MYLKDAHINQLSINWGGASGAPHLSFQWPLCLCIFLVKLNVMVKSLHDGCVVTMTYNTSVMIPVHCNNVQTRLLCHLQWFVVNILCMDIFKGINFREFHETRGHSRN
jgi:uncharacterized membrane protein YhaH (DUF805 family)